MPFGLNVTPRFFTKLIKPVLQKLKNAKEFKIAPTQQLVDGGGKEEAKIEKHPKTQKKTFKNWACHQRKWVSPGAITWISVSGIYPQLSQDEDRSHLGETKNKTLTLLETFSNVRRRTIRDLAKFIGNLNALSPAINYSPLFINKLIFIKNTAMNKINALKKQPR